MDKTIFTKCDQCGVSWVGHEALCGCDNLPKAVHVSAKDVLNSYKESSREKDLTQGIKQDGEKIRMDLLSPVALEELAKVLTFGAKKYAGWNWSKGINYTRLLASILRHTFAYMRGESVDTETGLSHIAHAMCNAMFILHFEKHRTEFDDRETDAYKPKNTVDSVAVVDNNDKKE